jgi:ADP-heptose:LPS heptosyltransferase
MSDLKYILVIRFSAIGDVALTTAVLRAVDPGDHKILVLSRSSYADFFNHMERTQFFRADLNGRHKGLTGIIRLVRDINRNFKITQVIDLHSVLRTWIIDLMYGLKGIRVNRIDKGRKDKKKFIKHKINIELPHNIERYSDVFRKAKLITGNPIIPSFTISDEVEKEATKIISHIVPKGYDIIGISPFTKHKTKSWGIDNIRSLMQLLLSEHKVYFFLFGGREELSGLETLSSSSVNCHIIAGKYNLEKELALISRLGFMISMDSANMHLAALSGIPTVSIWGGTHPAMGFAPYGNQEHIIVQTPDSELGCRPCTVYGKGDCIRKDIKYKCLKLIDHKEVFRHIKESGLLGF